jgi:hypothetical protein
MKHLAEKPNHDPDEGGVAALRANAVEMGERGARDRPPARPSEAKESRTSADESGAGRGGKVVGKVRLSGRAGIGDGPPGLLGQGQSDDEIGKSR